jgi:diketogulonate reductase-like aldo/keto reductase
MTSLGLGTWKLNGEVCEKAVYDAIKIGYRAIDTAQAYGNEAEVGKAVQKAISDGLVTRDELFIATKISFAEDAGLLEVRALVHKQLKLLQTDYIDLYYLHSPQKTDDLTRATWSGLEKMYKEGVIRSLGLSNHNSDQLKRHFQLIGDKGVAPMVLQNKFDVYHPGKQLDNKGDFILQTCADLNVQLVGYSPFSSFPFTMLPLEDPLVKEIAARRGNGDTSVSTPAAVLTQWSLQQGVALIPRSTSIKNLETNYAAAVLVGTGLTQEGKLRGSSKKGELLSADEMALLSSLSNLVSSPLVKPNYFTEPSNLQ